MTNTCALSAPLAGLAKAALQFAPGRSERQRTRSIPPPMLASDAVHRQLVEVLTTSGLAAGKA
jgi:hypothetical protein